MEDHPLFASPLFKEECDAEGELVLHGFRIEDEDRTIERWRKVAIALTSLTLPCNRLGVGTRKDMRTNRIRLDGRRNGVVNRNVAH